MNKNTKKNILIVICFLIIVVISLYFITSQNQEQIKNCTKQLDVIGKNFSECKGELSVLESRINIEKRLSEQFQNNFTKCQNELEEINKQNTTSLSKEVKNVDIISFLWLNVQVFQLLVKSYFFVLLIPISITALSLKFNVEIEVPSWVWIILLIFLVLAFLLPYIT